MNLKFEVTMEEGNLLIAALAKQPFEVVAGVINKLQQQARDQMQPPPETSREASKANSQKPGNED